ncbi:plasmid pRiA4b ORF-3 family protein [Streptomyces sp. NRRL WC-3549]|uniref:plasmid pRiA4b ORF-3 family protein n=1 Tax=Streptomyces sp. NRRL WC-3549 TaxID=1463925 RepID=UPI001F3AF110|nr:plasmid pRiA4b ORF-3 family protein [Streptomyces sp. NRRL WC-3549]
MYDFRGSWEHLITVEQFQTAEAGGHYPRCADGAGACPPEDCGGAPGYSALKVTSPTRRTRNATPCWSGPDSGPPRNSP